MERRWDEGRSHVTAADFPQVPIIGRRNDAVPTSGDVYLYRDPHTPDTEAYQPLFFADCEGFEGGAKIPAASKARKEFSGRKPGHGIKDNDDPDQFAESKGKLQWVLKYLGDGVRRQVQVDAEDVDITREQAVEKLFPRLMYNFSDIVVQVVPGQRIKTMEVKLNKVLDWAQASETAATNKLVLPKLLIVINQAAHDSPWDPAKAKEFVFEQHKDLLVQKGSKMQKCARRFRRLGVRIETIEDLLCCYYREVEVLYIPNAERGNNLPQLSKQLKLLYDLLQEGSKLSQEIKSKRHRLLSSADQARFFKLAFEHYARTPDLPFDFLEYLLKLHPLPNNLTNNLALFIDQVRTAATDGSHGVPKDLLATTTPVIASAVALDAARSYALMPGRLQEIYIGHSRVITGQNGELKAIASKGSYSNQVAAAFDEACSSFLRCEFRDVDGVRCVQTQKAHDATPLHRSRQGFVIGYGPFESAYAEELLRDVEEYMLSELANLEALVCAPSVRSTESLANAQLDLQLALNAHEERISRLFEQLPHLELISFYACFWCFTGIPIDRLPCDHVICADCANDFNHTGAPDALQHVEITGCILHDAESDASNFGMPYSIYIKPALAGPRILALDGGGVRGVIELKILQAIERRLGGHIPIQRFFDLIGGTSTGGLLAIGMVVKNWPLEELFSRFDQLCQAAFQRHSKHSIMQLFKAFISKGGKYSAEQFEESLQKMLGSLADEELMSTLVSVSIVFENATEPRLLGIEQTTYTQTKIVCNINC
jgi:hypothetical protein